MAVTPVFPVRPQKRRLDDLEEKEEDTKKVKKEENGSLQKFIAKNLVKEDHDQQEESKEVETLMVVAAKPQEHYGFNYAFKTHHRFDLTS